MVNREDYTGGVRVSSSALPDGKESSEQWGPNRRGFLKAAGAVGLGASGAIPGATASALAQQEGIRIGVLAPEPANNPIGASIARSAELAARQINADGGLQGSELSISVKNTREDPSTGLQRYRELTLGENVDLTVGIFTSEVLLNVIDDVARQQTLHMTTGAATPKASARVNEDYDRFKYHFRPGPINAHHLGVHLTEFGAAKFEEFGWDSIAVLVEDFEWTNPVSAVLDERLSEVGAEITMNRRYAANTENFTPIYDEVQNSDADAVLVAMAHTGTPALVQWAQQRRPFEFAGIHVPMQLPSYYGAVDGAARYAITQNSATPRSEITEKTVPYARAYNEAFDKFPVYTGYITFDAVNQYAAAVSEAGSTAADDVIPVLEGMSYTGTAGSIEYYDRSNEFAHDVVYGRDKVFPIFQQWQEEDGQGVQEVVFPDDLATAEHAKPPWL